MGVLRMMVATTKVMASVSRLNSSARTLRTRKATAPIKAPASAGMMAANGSVHKNGMSILVASVAVVYMPMPKKAPCPNEK
jgi:hypothetical protein